MSRCKRTNHTTTPALCLPAGEQISAPGAAARTAAERRRWLVVGMLADGAPLAAIMGATGYRPRSIQRIAERYRADGPDGLLDGRRRSQGATPLLSPDQQAELGALLRAPPADGGSWTGPKVARWIAARTGRQVHRQRGWEYLRRLAPTGTAKRRYSGEYMS